MLYRSYLHALLLPVFLGISLFGVSSLSAATQPLAPLPPAVIQTLVKMHQQPGSALPELLQQHLQETSDLIDEAQAEDQLLQAGKANLLSSKQQLLESKRVEIAGFRVQVEDELAQTRAKLAKLQLSEQLDSFDNYTAQVGQRFDSLNSALANFTLAQANWPRRAALSAAKVNVIGLQSPSGVTSPSVLPSPTTRLSYPVQPTPVKASQHPPRYLSALPVAPNTPKFASLLDALISSAIAAAPSTPSQATACSYTSADLAATEDVVINPAIQALAAQLNYSPVKIFQYVYNNIKYEPYFGSMKGSLGVMYSNAGGATDQSSFLIALLRASNIPARYVLGDIQVTDASNLGANGRGPLWIGAKTYQAAADILSSNLNPQAGALTSNNGIQLRHVWVEACLPYGNYRGAATDNSGYRWLPMDPSFKQNSYQPGIANMQNFVSFNYGATAPGYLAARTNTLPFENYESLINTYLSSNYPSNTLLDVPYLGSQIPQLLDILPVTLPYHVLQYDSWNGTSSSEASTLPASHRYQFTIKVRDSSNNVLVPDQTLDTVNLVDQRVTLSYQPADSGSLTIWKTWGGDLTNLPTGAVNVNLTPILNINGVAQTIANSASLKLGAPHNLVLEVTLGDTSLSQPSCRNDNPTLSALDTNLNCFNKAVYNNFVAGSYHALMAYARQGSESLIAEHVNQLSQSVQADAAPSPASAANYDAVEGEFLHLALLKYLNYVTAAGQTVGQLNGISGESGVHLGVTGAGLQVTYLFDLPYTVKPIGPYIDVLGNLFHFIKLDTSAPTTAEIWPSFKLTNYSASAYEHYIWQEMLDTDAVSTVRGLQFASEQGIPFVTLNPSNLNNWGPLLDSSISANTNYQSPINGYLSQGATITIPYKTIAYTDVNGTPQTQNWNGAIFMVENQAQGYMAAMISGGLGGGYPLLNYTPTSLLNPSDGFTPSTLFSSDSSSGWAINSTTLANGLNTLQSWAGDPVNLATGNLYHNERDISVPGRGLPLVFERNYNSRGAAANNGPLGYGWTHSFNHRLNFYGVDGTTGYIKVGWLDGTGNERFYRLAGSTVPVSSAFQPAPGVYSTLKRNADGSWSVTEKNGLIYSFESNAGTTANTSARLLKITDRNNNALTLSYTATAACPGTYVCTVTDGPGRQLAFSYTSGLINQIDVKGINGAIITSNDANPASYQYVYSNGNLTSYKSPLAVAGKHNPVSYSYYTSANGANLNNAMKTYALPQGEGMQFAYYTDGRVFQHQRTNNGALVAQTTTFRYQDFRRQTVTVNELGNTRTHTFDVNGNPISIIDETGATHTYTYDTPANPFNRLTETDPNGLVTAYKYDGLGNVTLITQPNTGTTQYFNFTSFNAPQYIKDALGNYTVLNYDSKGNLTDSIKLKSNIVPATGSPPSLPAIANIAAWRKMAYDGSYGQLIKTKNLRLFTNSSLGTFIPASGTDPYGPTVTTTYDANTLYPTQISRLGDKDGNGVINSQDTPDTATLSFDSLGRQTQGIDAEWQTISTTYDADSRPQTGTDTAGQQRNFSYDGDGRLTSNELELTQNNQKQLWDSGYRSYDPTGRLQETLDAGGNAMQYQYDAAGNLLQITDPDSYTLSYSYDAANRWMTAADKAGHNVSRTLDASGRIKTSTDANGNTTIYSYYGAAQNGRLQLVTQPTVSGFTTSLSRQYSYDLLGRVTQTTDTPATPVTGTALNSRSTLYTYNAQGQLVRVAGPQITDSDPSSNTYNTLIRTATLYSYDSLGQLLNIQAGKTTSDGGASINQDTGVSSSDTVTTQVSYLKDDFGRTLKETDANGNAANYTYDVNNNVLTANTANGHTLTYTWGYGHQELSVSAEDGRNVQYNRNPLGQITNAQTWSASPSNLDIAYYYSYDASHRLVNVTDSRANKTLSYNWSPGGLLNSLTDADWNSTNYLYDPTGRLTSVWATNFDGYSFAYDNGGRLTQVVYPNGVSQTQTWNADNTLAQISHQNGSTIIEQSAYGYDGFGRRQSNQETLSGQTTLSYTYSYDALDRLSNVSNGTATQTETYGYDRFGNRVQKQIATSPTTPTTYAYLYDAANQLTETHQSTTSGALLEAYLYDKSGNETQKCSGGTVTHAGSTACSGSTVQGYVYNSFNRLSQYNGAITGNYLYDHQGRRIQKIEGPNALNFLYDGNNIYEEYLTSSWSTPNAMYVQAGTDHPLARLTGTVGAPTATAAYYHQDGLGSVLATTSGSKSVTATQRFNAFGNIIGGSGTVPEYGYTGREPDASGLIYYRARYYDPNQVRFTQRDPLGVAAGINRYTYVGNNPVNFNDPSGLFANNISNAYTQTASYFNNNAYAAFGGGLVVGGAAGYGVGYGLAALSTACLPCGAVAGAGLLGYSGYQLASDNFAGAQNIYNSFQAVGSGTATSGQAFTAGSTLGGVIGGVGGAYASGSVGGGANSAADLYHYTSSAYADSIVQNGLKPSISTGLAYATPDGTMSGLQAQIDLALPPNRGVPDALLKIDTSTLNQMGVDIPAATQVLRDFNMPGGGQEVIFNSLIPPEAITRVK